MKRIIFPLSDGMAVMIPAEKSGLPIEQIARKDVPAGVPYRFIDASDVPDDRSQRELWAADFSAPDGYGIGQDAWFAEQKAIRAEADRVAAEKAEADRVAAEKAEADRVAAEEAVAEIEDE